MHFINMRRLVKPLSRANEGVGISGELKRHRAELRLSTELWQTTRSVVSLQPLAWTTEEMPPSVSARGSVFFPLSVHFATAICSTYAPVLIAAFYVRALRKLHDHAMGYHLIHTRTRHFETVKESRKNDMGNWRLSHTRPTKKT